MFFVPFLLAMSGVFLAEMGDKTQLLAMAFSTRYRWYTVLWAVAVATALNHLLAVVAGSVITNIIPIDWIKLLAALSFLIFGLWTLHDDTSPEARARAGASPFLTVGVAFFIAEMGDKTQLFTMTFAANQAAQSGASGVLERVMMTLPVWAGTTVGMILADAVGILAGVVMRKSIPTRVVKWVAASAFAIFGLIGLHQSLDVLLPKGSAAHHAVLIALVPVMAVLMFLIARRSARRAGAEGANGTTDEH